MEDGSRHAIHVPGDHQLRRWFRWSWTLIGLSLVAPLVAALVSDGMFELAYPVKEYDPVEWGLKLEDESSAERAWEKYFHDEGPSGAAATQAAAAKHSAAQPIWEIGVGLIGGGIVFVLQLISIRFGIRLARFWPHVLWWVVPQMILVISAITELTICAIFLLFGQGQTALQFIAIIGVSLPIVFIVTSLIVTRLARSILAQRNAHRGLDSSV